MTQPSDTALATGRGLPTRYRWWIVVLLFFSTTINYVDRALFSNLVPYFEGDVSLKLGPMDLAYINVAFLLSYGLGMMFVGRFVDRVGVWIGLAVTFLVWNVASVGHAFVFSVGGFVLIRILLGLGEAGNFPAAVKAVAVWFPRKERALATGWFNCGSNVGAVITPLSVPLIADRFGWRVAFGVLGGVGVVWLFFWLAMYRRPEAHPKVSPGELAFIHSDPPEPGGRIPVLTLLSQRPVYGYALARFFTEAPWWFYLTWVPKILADTYGLTSYQRAWAIAVVYIVADFGAVGGGWISSSMIKRGATINRARKTGLLIAALGTVPMVSVAWMQGVQTGAFSMVWIVVPLLSIAAACHQAWSSNLYTVISDTLPRNAVATTVGIGSAFGAVGSSAFQVMVAIWLLKTQSYTLPFLFAGSLYLVGLAVLHLILPRLEPAQVDEHTKPRLAWWQVAVAGATMVAILAGLQLWLNRPAYGDVADYYRKRAGQLQASGYVVGPAAKVGWQDALWVKWATPQGEKWELIKLDRHARPLVETKGTAARQYAGPTLPELAAQTMPAPTSRSAATTREGQQMKINLKLETQTLRATLYENASAREFASLLPLTLTLEDYATTEKISDLPKKLTSAGAPAGADPAPGDIAYYAPWGNLAIYYKDFGYSDGLILLGKLESDPAAISGPKPLKVRIEVSEEGRRQ